MFEGPIGSVRVLSKLGEGAHSTILRVIREKDSKEYALKLVNIDSAEDQKFLEQAKHEFRVGQMLDHPNLIKVSAFETEKNWLFQIKKAKLLIEYINGPTLDHWKVSSQARLFRIFEQVASGIAHMHKHGALHADLKPNNILVGPRAAKVIDYGLAWIKGEPKSRVQGTPEYMAPETASHKIVNERTDIYNFGATMYRMVTFQLPVSSIDPLQGGSLNEKSFRGFYKPVDELAPGTPPVLVNLIHSCMSFKATKRPERMSEVQGVLDKLADEYEAKEE